MKKFKLITILILGWTYLIFAQPSTPDPNFWITNGVVHTIAVDGDYTYIGGGFTYVGPNNGSGAKMTTTSDVPDQSFPKVNGQINVAVPDGSGGWLIGGTFTMVGTFNRNLIARINSNGAVDPTWNPNASGVSASVNTIAVSGSDIYVGGNFSMIGGQTRNRIAKLNNTDGTADPFWNPNPVPSGAVNTIAISGNDIYVGGQFTSIGGLARNRLAKLNNTTGAADLTWNPNANNVVSTIAISGDDIYVGGLFSTIGSQPKNGIAKLDDIYGAANPIWNSSVSVGFVQIIAINGSDIYVGGDIIINGGQSRGVAKLSNIDGSTDPIWNPNPDGASQPEHITTIAISGNDIYVGGIFESIGGQQRKNIARLNNTDGSADPNWHPDANNFVFSIAISGNSIFIGGQFTSIGGETRKLIARMNNTIGIVDPTWNPNAIGTPSATVRTISISGSDIYVGGDFSMIGGQTRNRIAKLNNTDGTADPTWNPNVIGTISVIVQTIAISGNDIYAGGNFTSIGGQPRTRLAKLNNTDGSADPTWIQSPNLPVYTIAISGNDVYVGGQFTSIGGQPRTRLAKLNNTDGSADATWIPNPNNNVNTIAISGNDIYVGGQFTSIGGQTRNRLAKLSSTGGTVDPTWIPNPNNNVNTIAISGNDIYVGGQFSSSGGQSRNNIAKLNNITGSADPLWNPNAGGTAVHVYSIAIDGSDICAGGTFTSINGVFHPFLALFRGVPVSNIPPGFISPTPSCGTPFTIDVDHPFTFTVAAEDLDAGDIVTLSASGLPSGSVMNPVLPSTGNPVSSDFSWTPDLASVGNYTVTYEITDGNSTPVSCSFNIEVINDNVVPTFVEPTPVCGSPLTAYVGSALTFTVSAQDADATDIISLTSGTLPTGSAMNPVLPISGNPVSSDFSWTPDLASVGNHTLTFEITDGYSVPVTCSFDIEVINSNVAPVFIEPTPASGSTLTVYAGSPIIFTVRAEDSDAGNIVELFVAGLPLGSSMNPPLPFAANPVSSEFSWTPTSAEVGSYELIYTAVDNFTALATCTLTVIVAEVPAVVCPLNQLFWKDNPALWPVETLVLGTLHSYDKARLLTILGSTDLRDASVILAKQLIAAKLNLANGAPVPVEVADMIVNSDRSIDKLVIPAGIRPISILGLTMLRQAITLLAYNNNLLTLGCSSTLAKQMAIEEEIVIPVSDYALFENYPNPFNPTTRIMYSVPNNEFVTLKVFNTIGEEIMTLVNEVKQPGLYEVEFISNGLPSGVYLYRIISGDFVETKKMILMK